MKADHFSESLNQIQDSYIEEAIRYQAPKKAPKKSSSALKVWRVIAIIACALLAVSIGIAAIGAVGGMRMGSAAGGGAAYNETASYSGGPYTDGISEEYANETFDGTLNGAAGAAEAEGAQKQASGPSDSAKIIYTAHLSISTKDFEASAAKIEDVLKAHGGYLENMNLNNASSSYRSAYYQIRIPAGALDTFLKEAEEFGSITTLNRGASDVSKSYYDTESRLETAKKKLKRLQELLSQASDMSDIITIEESISDVEWEIDDLSGVLKNYDSDVEFSTVSIELDEVYQITNDDVPLTFGERISQSFHNGLHTFGQILEDLLVWIAASWLWILIIGIVIAAVIVIIVKSERKSR